jgi:hypothetical protein
MRKMLIALILSLLTVPMALAAPAAEVTNNEITLDFPETATFRATITGAAEITSVVLEYGNEQQTCGEVVAKAFSPIYTGKNRPGGMDLGNAPERLLTPGRDALVAMARDRREWQRDCQWNKDRNLAG